MFTIRKLMGILDGNTLKKVCVPFIPIAMGLTLLGTPVAFADDAVNLKVLVVTTGDITQDLELAYIKPVLDEMGVRYDVLNASITDLKTTTLSPAGCASATVGCVGNYNGVMLTDSFLTSRVAPVSYFTPTEWDILHNYERNFHVREVVLSGWPQQTYWDPVTPFGVYLDYGLAYSSSIDSLSPSSVSTAKWTPTATNSTTIFEYVNTANPLPITNFAFTAKARNDGLVLRDGTVPSVIPLLQTPAGEALISIIQYNLTPAPVPAVPPVREVMLSSIANASFLTHSQVLSYELINWVTQGVFVGGRFVYMSNHLDDLFLENELWDVTSKTTNPLLLYRLTSADITNAVSKQAAFRVAHPTSGTATEPFMLDFAFNGTGAVVRDPVTELPVTPLKADLTEDLVAAVVANKTQFRFINHTFSHADMDKVPVPANPKCDYPTLATTALIEAEITNNKTVWGLLGLPDQLDNERVLVTGNHSGLKDRKCTDYPELHPTMANVQSDDVAFITGANPLFVTAATNLGLDYIASDTSQLNQAIEQYFTVSKNKVALSTNNTGRVMLPRFPTNIFYNAISPNVLVSEYNYIFNERYKALGQDPCTVAGAICTPRDYPAILEAEATAAVQHMLSFKKYPHFFHQGNVAKYDAAGNTLQFDWLNSVFTAYEKLFKLPVKSLPYYLIGDMTKESLIAKSATIKAIWNRTAKTVTLSANKSVPNLLVTGIQGPDIYGGQIIRQISVNTTPKTIAVNQLLTQ